MKKRITTSLLLYLKQSGLGFLFSQTTCFKGMPIEKGLIFFPNYFRIGILALILFSNCKTADKLSTSVDGFYYKKGPDFEYSLTLKKDSTFTLIKAFNLHGTSECSGNWKIKEKDELVLTCFETKKLSKLLSSGYMNQRTHTVKQINYRKVKLENIILNRK